MLNRNPRSASSSKSRKLSATPHQTSVHPKERLSDVVFTRALRPDQIESGFHVITGFMAGALTIDYLSRRDVTLLHHDHPIKDFNYASVTVDELQKAADQYAGELSVCNSGIVFAPNPDIGNK